MLEARTIDVAIDRPWRDVYDRIWRPECFTEWASGLARSSLTAQGDSWIAEGPDGPVTIRFTPRNSFGVMDHSVELQGGMIVHVPMRIIANGAGALILLTLFRQPGMSEELFLADIAWVERDLAALRALIIGETD